MDILFLAHRAPFAPDRGDRIRGYHILKHLAARARVHLVAFADSAADAAPPPELAAMLASCVVVPRRKSGWRAGIDALRKSEPVSLAAFEDWRITAAIQAVGPVDVAYIFSGQMARYLPLRAGRVIMDFVDRDSAKFEAYAARAPWPLSWLHAREARLLGAFEREVAGKADHSLFVSAAEAAPGASVVENGIDADFYDPARATPVPELGPLIVFTGQMNYAPNAEAVRWFARDVLPRVRERHPEARFAIVGRSPGRKVRALADKHVIVTGEVSDVRGWIAAADVVVAPLLTARGIQNKVLEAMAMARPVVATPEAAEGIDHRGTIAVAGGAKAFADAVSAALDGPRVNAAARAHGLARYAWPERLAALDPLIGFTPPPEPAEAIRRAA